MLISYAVLIKRNIQEKKTNDQGKKRNGKRKIIKIWIPDLNKTIEGERLNQYNKGDLIRYLQSKIKRTVEGLIERGFKFEKPKKLKEYKDHPLDMGDMWTKIFIDIDLPRGFFERRLSQVGVITNLISTLCYSVIAIIAMQLAAGSDDLGKGLGISGAIVGFVLSIIIYQYSNARSNLSKLGKLIDDKIHGRKKYNILSDDNTNDFDCISSTAIMAGKLGLGTVLFFNTVIYYISEYQMVTALGKRAEENDIYIPNGLVQVVALVLAILGGAAALSFEGSFVKEAIDEIVRWAKARRNTNDEILRHLPQGININSSSSRFVELNEYTDTDSDRNTPSYATTSHVQKKEVKEEEDRMLFEL